MTYRLQNVPLVAQDLNNACWYASAQMIIQWRQAHMQACEGAHPNPEYVPPIVTQYRRNSGLFPAQFTPLAKLLGLREVPPSSPTPDGLATWLATYGPIWFAGYWPSPHVVVITGVSAVGVHVNDPWPVNSGNRHVLTWERFAQILQPINLGAQLASNLLYLPG